MKTITKRFITLITIMAMIFSTTVVSYAKDTATKLNSEPVEITFQDLKIAPNQQYRGIDSNGNEYTIGIELVCSTSKGATQTWRVYYNAILANAEFYMDVTDNKCTAVYDEAISTFGGTFDNSSLTRTSTYGKLTFDFIAVNGIAQGTLWLKGTVTGSNNEVTVTARF